MRLHGYIYATKYNKIIKREKLGRGKVTEIFKSDLRVLQSNVFETIYLGSKKIRVKFFDGLETRVDGMC